MSGSNLVANVAAIGEEGKRGVASRKLLNDMQEHVLENERKLKEQKGKLGGLEKKLQEQQTEFLSIKDFATAIQKLNKPTDDIPTDDIISIIKLAEKLSSPSAKLLEKVEELRQLLPGNARKHQALSAGLLEKVGELRQLFPGKARGNQALVNEIIAWLRREVLAMGEPLSKEIIQDQASRGVVKSEITRLEKELKNQREELQRLNQELQPVLAKETQEFSAHRLKNIAALNIKLQELKDAIGELKGDTSNSTLVASCERQLALLSNTDITATSGDTAAEAAVLEVAMNNLQRLLVNSTELAKLQAGLPLLPESLRKIAEAQLDGARAALSLLDSKSEGFIEGLLAIEEKLKFVKALEKSSPARGLAAKLKELQLIIDGKIPSDADSLRKSALWLLNEEKQKLAAGNARTIGQISAENVTKVTQVVEKLKARLKIDELQVGLARLPEPKANEVINLRTIAQENLNKAGKILGGVDVGAATFDAELLQVKEALSFAETLETSVSVQNFAKKLNALQEEIARLPDRNSVYKILTATHHGTLQKREQESIDKLVAGNLLANLKQSVDVLIAQEKRNLASVSEIDNAKINRALSLLHGVKSNLLLERFVLYRVNLETIPEGEFRTAAEEFLVSVEESLRGLRADSAEISIIHKNLNIIKKLEESGKAAADLRKQLVALREVKDVLVEPLKASAAALLVRGEEQLSGLIKKGIDIDASVASEVSEIAAKLGSLGETSEKLKTLKHEIDTFLSPPELQLPAKLKESFEKLFQRLDQNFSEITIDSDVFAITQQITAEAHEAAEKLQNIVAAHKRLTELEVNINASTLPEALKEPARKLLAELKGPLSNVTLDSAVAEVGEIHQLVTKGIDKTIKVLKGLVELNEELTKLKEELKKMVELGNLPSTLKQSINELLTGFGQKLSGLTISDAVVETYGVARKAREALGKLESIAKARAELVELNDVIAELQKLPALSANELIAPLKESAIRLRDSLDRQLANATIATANGFEVATQARDAIISSLQLVIAKKEEISRLKELRGKVGNLPQEGMVQKRAKFILDSVESSLRGLVFYNDSSNRGVPSVLSSMTLSIQRVEAIEKSQEAKDLEIALVGLQDVIKSNNLSQTSAAVIFLSFCKSKLDDFLLDPLSSSLISKDTVSAVKDVAAEVKSWHDQVLIRNGIDRQLKSIEDDINNVATAITKDSAIILKNDPPPTLAEATAALAHIEGQVAVVTTKVGEDFLAKEKIIIEYKAALQDFEIRLDSIKSEELLIKEAMQMGLFTTETGGFKDWAEKWPEKSTGSWLSVEEKSQKLQEIRELTRTQIDAARKQIGEEKERIATINHKVEGINDSLTTAKETYTALLSNRTQANYSKAFGALTGLSQGLTVLKNDITEYRETTKYKWLCFFTLGICKAVMASKQANVDAALRTVEAKKEEIAQKLNTSTPVTLAEVEKAKKVAEDVGKISLLSKGAKSLSWIASRRAKEKAEKDLKAEEPTTSPSL